MAILADSSVLVAASHRAHPHHKSALNWLQSALARTEVAASAHALAEVYGTLTKPGPKGMFRVPPSDAARIVARLRNRLRIVALSVQDYRALIDLAVSRGVVGAELYDLLHVFAAQKAGAKRIATLNERHFAQLWAPSQLIVP